LRRRATSRSDRGERSISANGEGMVSERVDPKLLAKALDRLRSALALLDGTSAPGQIGAHVDLALQQLLSFIERATGGGSGHA